MPASPGSEAALTLCANTGSDGWELISFTRTQTLGIIIKNCRDECACLQLCLIRIDGQIDFELFLTFSGVIVQQ